jgi:hypothetical protein
MSLVLLDLNLSGYQTRIPDGAYVLESGVSPDSA